MSRNELFNTEIFYVKLYSNATNLPKYRFGSIGCCNLDVTTWLSGTEQLNVNKRILWCDELVLLGHV